MWGNRLGWKISAFIWALAIGLWVWLNLALAITARTPLSLDEKNLSAISLPGGAILPQDDPGDSGELYRQAIALYQDQSTRCEEFAKDPRGNPPPAIQLVLDAAGKSSMQLFSKTPEQFIDYKALDQHPPLDDLYSMGMTMNVAGLRFQQTGDLPSARQYFRAVYALGQNLARERLVYDEYQKGIGLMGGSLQGLLDCEKPGSLRAKELNSQISEMEQYNSSFVQPIYNVLASADQGVIGANAGDVFAFATVSQDRMFRVEAILKLGRYRFDAQRRGDQLGASRYLRKLARDPDPIIRTAAGAATDLTIEQYRMIH
jgi:hypothetical protein